MRVCRPALVVSVSLLVGPAAADAGPNANAKILLHLVRPTSEPVCTAPAAFPACDAVVTSGDLYPTTYFAYLLVADGDSAAGVAGLQVGIQYDAGTRYGVDIFEWVRCADAEFQSPGWPASGTGTILIWNPERHCQRTIPAGNSGRVVAVAGYFYCSAYTPGYFLLVPRPLDGIARVDSCVRAPGDTFDVIESTTFRHTPSHLGKLTFSTGGQMWGHNPCGQ